MNSGVQPDPQGEQTPAGGLAFGDILFTLFRHKYLILGSLILGLVAAIAVRFVKPPNYESTAQIYVPYVVDLKTVNPSDPNTPITSTGVGGDMVMNTEVDTLKSFDTAVEVVKEIGAGKILARYGGGSNELGAAGVVASGISVNPPRTMSLTVTFSHRDPELVQPVMAAIVKVYMRRHRDIHFRGDGFFVERREEARKKLEGIEKELTLLKTSAGVPDLRERMNAVSKEYANLQSQVLKSKSDLARSKAELGEFASTASLQTNAIPSEQISSYSEILALIEEIKKKKRAMILEDDLTTNHPAVVKLEVKMDEQLRQKILLEKQFPSLTNYVSAGPKLAGASGTNVVRFDLESSLGEINRLERTIKSDEAVLVGLKDEAFRLMEIEPKLTELERRRDGAKKDYEFFMSSAEKANSDSNSAGGAIQIAETQKPTPPRLNQKKLLKLVGAAFGGCVGLGLGIAFLLDMVLDRSIRRPSQIIRGLRLPVVLTIPDANRKDSSLFSWGRRNGNMKLMRPDKKGGPADQSSNAVAPWSPDNKLQSHIEGLRERVITHFEVRNLEHNPKLVAVTACMDGAGVSTLASGLAATLSRTGNGSVLLVDMNSGEGVTHSFYKGKPGYGPAESIETDSETDFEDEKTSKNLSLTKHDGRQSKRDRLAGMLPPGFNDLRPNLKADAYDYVVFDMTAISPASVTPRLSGHMDLVLFVIESETTKDHTARNAADLMRESRANVLAILNKYHNPVPSWLAHD